MPVSLRPPHFVNQFVFATSSQQGQDLQQGKDDLAVAHQGCERCKSCVQVFHRDLPDFGVSMSGGDYHLSDLFGDGSRHVMIEDLGR